MAPRDIAKEVRPLIGLNDRQAAANQKYKQEILQRYLERGMSESKAAERAEKAALKYAAKQHRYRAESIVLTENAYAYNRGAHMSVCQSIADGYMGRCAMIWTTAGTNRVCSRCLALKDTVVGYTDELGVLLPPLHPRCRCAIMYDEVGTPRATRPKPTINPLLPAAVATEIISPATPEPQTEPSGLAAGNAIYFNEGGKSPYKIGKIDFDDAAQIEQVLDWVEARIVTAPVENAIIITTAGEIYHCTGGLNTLDTIKELGEKLYRAIVTHNHPVGSVNEYSFSELDWFLFRDYKLTRLRGVDERFNYEFNRNPADIDEIVFISDANKYNFRHGQVVDLARENKIGYRRWAR